MEEINIIKAYFKRVMIIIFSIIFYSILVILIMNKFILEKPYYKNSDFKIKNIYSKVDYNKNNIDDYSDILLGARKLVGKNIKEKELLSKSFKYAGYDIISLIGEDTSIKGINKYFAKNTYSLTNNIKVINKFNYGDIIIYDEGLGIVSDRRNKEGITFLIYIKNNIVVEEDIMPKLKILGHYRFDATLIDNLK